MVQLVHTDDIAPEAVNSLHACKLESTHGLLKTSRTLKKGRTVNAVIKVGVGAVICLVGFERMCNRNLVLVCLKIVNIAQDIPKDGWPWPKFRTHHLGFWSLSWYEFLHVCHRPIRSPGILPQGCSIGRSYHE